MLIYYVNNVNVLPTWTQSYLPVDAIRCHICQLNKFSSKKVSNATELSKTRLRVFSIPALSHLPQCCYYESLIYVAVPIQIYIYLFVYYAHLSYYCMCTSRLTWLTCPATRTTRWRGLTTTRTRPCSSCCGRRPR